MPAMLSALLPRSQRRHGRDVYHRRGGLRVDELARNESPFDAKQYLAAPFVALPDACGATSRVRHSQQPPDRDRAGRTISLLAGSVSVASSCLRT
jgi:hypothetical protein